MITANPPATLSDPLWTAAQVAEALGLSERGISHLHRTWRLRGLVVNGHLRWKRSHVTKYIQDLEAEQMLGPRMARTG